MNWTAIWVTIKLASLIAAILLIALPPPSTHQNRYGRASTPRQGGKGTQMWPRVVGCDDSAHGRSAILHDLTCYRMVRSYQLVALW